MGGTTVTTTLKTIVMVVLTVFVMVLFSACELFSVGLGSKVDITAPTVEILSPTRNEYVTGSIDIEGMAADDTAVADVTVRLLNTGGTVLHTGSAILEENAFRYTVDTSSRAYEGEIVLVATATDNGGKTSTDRTSMFIDNSAPTVLVTSPLTYGDKAPRQGDYIDIKGEVYDRSPIKQVRVSILNSPAPDNTLRATQIADGTNTWTTRFMLKDALLNPEDDEKTFRYSVVVEDEAGNISTYYYHRTDIYDILPVGSMFPSMLELGRLDQDATLATSTPTGIHRADLVEKRISLTAGGPLADFVYDHDAKPEVTFTNVDKTALPASNLIGIGAPIIGLIIPPPDSGAINRDTFVAKLYSMPEETRSYSYTDSDPDSDSDRVVITSLGDSVSFRVDLKDDGGLPVTPGQYRIEITADTQGGLTSGPIRADFVIDSGAPVISETAVGTGNVYRQGVFSLSGAAHDSIGITNITVEWSRNSAPFETAPGGVLSPSTEQKKNWNSWTWTSLEPPTLQDGYYEIKVTLNSSAGRTAVVNRIVTVDTAAPLVGFKYPSPYREVVADVTVNGSTVFGAEVSDDSSVQIRRWMLPATSAAPDWDTADYVTWGPPAANISVQTPALLDLTDYKLWVIARDRAGNETRQSQAFRVDQSTDTPRIMATNLAADATTNSANSLGQNPAILVTIEDDDLVQVSSLQYRIDANNDGDFNDVVVLATPGNKWGDESVWYSFDEKPASDRSLIQGKIILTGFPQGEFRIELKASDNQGTARSMATTAPIRFAVDYGPPSVSITSPASGTYKDSFTLSGTAVDALGLIGIKYRMEIGGDSAYTELVGISGTLVNFSKPIDISSLSSGEYAFQVVATDLGGLSSTTQIPVTIDRILPTVSFLEPAASSILNGASVSLRGEAQDNRLVGAVFVWHGLVADPDPVLPSMTSSGVYDSGGYVEATGGAVWNTPIDTTSVIFTAANAYRIRAVAIDAIGNVGIPLDRVVTVNQESDRPDIAFSNLETSGTPSRLGTGARIIGVFEDDDGVSKDHMQIRLDRNGDGDFNDDGESWVGISNRPASNSIFASWFHDIGDLTSQGRKYVQVRALDINASQANKDIFTAFGSSAGLTGYTWTETSKVEFYIDYGPPALVLTAPVSGTRFGVNSFVVQGTTNDGNGVDHVSIWVDDDGDQVKDAGEVLWIYRAGTVSIPGLVVSTSIPANFAARDSALSITLDDAVYSIIQTISGLSADPAVKAVQISSFDTAGAGSVRDLTIIIDTQKPHNLAFEIPAAEAILNGSITVRGLANDNYQLHSVFYARTAGHDTAAPVYPGTDWILATGSYAWSYGLTTTAIADGPYNLHVIAVDTAGNLSDVVSRNVTINQDSDRPVIRILTLDEAAPASSNLLPSTLTVSGTVQDDDLVNRLSIQVRQRMLPAGVWSSWASVSGQPGSNTSFLTWSHQFTGLVDGLYEFEVRAADGSYAWIADQSWPGTASPGGYSWGVSAIAGFAVDLSLPGGSITTPVQGSFHRSNVPVSGTSSDLSGVKKVTIAYAVSAAAYGTEKVLYNDTIPGNGYEQTYDWSDSFEVTPGDNHQVFFRVSITDAFDKIRTFESYITVDTASPTLGFTQPNAGSLLNGAAQFRGTANDAGQVTQIWYKLNSNTDPGTWTSPAVLSDNGWTLAAGTYSWSFPCRTDSLADGAAKLYIVAVDAAGNRSNPGLPANQLAFTVNQAANLPQISFSTADHAVVVASGFITGTVTDDDGVNASTIQISFNSTNGMDGDWVNVTNQGSNGLTVNWSHSLAAVPERAAAYNVYIRVNDIGQDMNNDGDLFDAFDFPAVLAVSTPKPVYRDNGAPAFALDQILIQNKYGGADISIFSGFNGIHVYNDFSLFFTATDAAGIAYVRYSLDGTPWLPDGSSLPRENAGAGPHFVAALPISGFTDGTRTIHFQAADQRGNTASGSIVLVIDSIDPAVTFISPAGMTEADPPNINGAVTIQGSVSDVSAITSLTIRGGRNRDVALSNGGNNLNWRTTLSDSSAYATIAYAAETGSGSKVWRFPVEVTAIDVAGNKAVTLGYIDIDPDSDRPVVSVLSPSPGGSVAGVFLINGTVMDDDGAQSVRLHIDLDNDGLYTRQVDLNGDGDTADDFEDEAIHKAVAVTNGTWSILLNSSGEFNKSNLITRGISGASGTIGFKAIPVDINGTLGESQSQTVYIDSEAPIIKGLAIDGITETLQPTPAGNSLQKGFITIRVLFQDDRDLGTSSMQASLDGGVSYRNISTLSGATISADVGGGNPYKYRVQIPVDTTTVVAGGNGYLTVILRITDRTFKQSSYTLEYFVDNTRPQVLWNVPNTISYLGTIPNEVYSFNGDLDDADRINQVFGKAIDDGLINGIDRIDVFFVKAGSFINPRTGATQAISSSNQYRSGLDLNGDGDYSDSNEYPPAVAATSIPYTADANWVIRIDKRTELGQFDSNETLGDQDGFQESLRSRTGYDEWYSFFNTRILPDGPLEVYFLAYDEVGNASFNRVNAQIANNPPSIGSVEIGPTVLSGSNRKVKKGGNQAFRINATDVEGVTVADFRLSFLERYNHVASGPDLANPIAITPFFYGSQSGAVADFSSRTPASGNASSASATITLDLANPGRFAGGSWYLAEAETKDTDGNLNTWQFHLWVYNTDAVLPVVGLDPFTQASVTSLSGHIEEASNSPHGDSQADLSGTVRVTGTVSDDTQVNSVNVQYSLNGGTSWTDAGTATLNLVSSDVLLGVSYTWSYTWNTATIPNAAALDVQLRVRAVDGQNIGTSATRTVDVVPYTTNVSTGLDTGLRSLVRRSALGRYPVVVGGAVTLQGYNFNGSISTVTVGGTAAPVASGSTTSLVLNMAGISTSGEVIVTTNGAASQNHTNNNDLPQNQEPNAYNDNLKDNRFIAFWQRSSLDALAYRGVVDAVLRPNGSRNDFDWIYARNGRQLWHYRGITNNAIMLTEGLSLGGGDFTFNASGSMAFIFNHNNAWIPGNTLYEYSGSMQWGLLPVGASYTYTAEPDAAYNWAVNAGLPRVALGNQSFNGNPMSWTPYNTYNTQDINRFRHPRVISVGVNAASRNYVAYFDAGAGQARNIVFWNFKVGTTKTSVDSTGSPAFFRRTETTAGSITLTASHGTWYANIDKYFTATNDSGRYALTGNIENNKFGVATPRGRQEITAVNSMSNSEYFDLGIRVVNTTTHYAFIAYYDETAGSLKITANEGAYTADPLTAGIWTSPQTIDLDSGAHVAMAIDPDGGIHLAYQDTQSSYLKYSYLTYNAANDSFTIVRRVYVDALIGSGLFNSITIKDFGTADYRPVITTYSSAFAGSNVALRMAYPITNPLNVAFGAGADFSNGKFTGHWESVAVMASTNPQGMRNFTFTDGSTETKGRIHVGYNGAYLEENTYLAVN